MNSMIIYSVLALLMFAADQWTKNWAAAALQGNAGITVVPGILNFVYVENRGIAFGMLKDMQPVLVPMSFAILVACVILAFHYHKKKKPVALTALTLVIAGAAGNLVDKIWKGYVVDFIYASFIDFPVFNLADIFICTGAVLFAVYILFLDKEERHNENHL